MFLAVKGLRSRDQNIHSPRAFDVTFTIIICRKLFFGGMQSQKLLRLSESERNCLKFQLLLTNRSSTHLDNKAKICQLFTMAQI